MFLEKEELPSNLERKNIMNPITDNNLNNNVNNNNLNNNIKDDNYYVEDEEQEQKNIFEQPKENNNDNINNNNNIKDNILNTSGISSIKNDDKHEDENLNRKLSKEHNFSKDNIEEEKEEKEEEEDEFTKNFKRKMAAQKEVVQKEGPLIHDRVREEAFNALLNDDNISEISKNNKKQYDKSPIDDFENLEDFVL